LKVLTILLAWLFADFLTGLVHFAEDRFFVNKSRFAFINRVIADNELHHRRPAQMLKFSYWQNINTSAYVAWPIALALFLGGSHAIWWLTVFFASFGNLVHRFGHEHRSKIPIPIRILQKSGLFISFEHHWCHHFDLGLISRERTVGKFCPMTNWLNPVLDHLWFWYILEQMIWSMIWVL
jgi:ubiquitin-conjugating enzyme E2 variant